MINTDFTRKHRAQTVLTVLGLSGVVLIFLPFGDDATLGTVFLEQLPLPLPPFDMKVGFAGFEWFFVPLVVLPFAISAGYLRWLLTGQLSRAEAGAGYALAFLIAGLLVVIFVVDWLLLDWVPLYAYPFIAFGAGAGFAIQNLRSATPPVPNALAAMQVVYLPAAVFWIVVGQFSEAQIGFYLTIVTVLAYSVQIVMAAKRAWQALIFFVPLALFWVGLFVWYVFVWYEG